VGFLTRLLVPRSVRRAAHPVRAVKRAATPKIVKKATRAMHPLDNAVYGLERSVATSLRSGGRRRFRAQRKGRAPVYRHRRFFDKGTEQGAAGTPYEHEAVAVIAALLRNTVTGELQKLLADGLAYASSLQGADLQECNLSRAYLGQRPRAVVAHASVRLLAARRWGQLRTAGAADDQPSSPGPGAPIDLTVADLFHADLTSASLRGAIARNAIFYTAVAKGTVFEGARLEGADFRQAELEGARFTGAWIERARFDGAHEVPPNVARLLDQGGQVPAGEGMPVPPV
jgi:uncharacterized protein YjbI with pentapeptide repeats